jgi:hypothetical protein
MGDFDEVQVSLILCIHLLAIIVSGVLADDHKKAKKKANAVYKDLYRPLVQVRFSFLPSWPLIRSLIARGQQQLLCIACASIACASAPSAIMPLLPTIAILTFLSLPPVPPVLSRRLGLRPAG